MGQGNQDNEILAEVCYATKEIFPVSFLLPIVSYPTSGRRGLVSGLHRNSAYLERRAALASCSDPSRDADKTPVLLQSCRSKSVRIAIFRAPTKSEWHSYLHTVHRNMMAPLGRFLRVVLPHLRHICEVKLASTLTVILSWNGALYASTLCNSAKAQDDVRLLARRCFFVARLPFLRFVPSRMPVRCSKPMSAWGC